MAKKPKRTVQQEDSSFFQRCLSQIMAFSLVIIPVVIGLILKLIEIPDGFVQQPINRLLELYGSVQNWILLWPVQFTFLFLISPPILIVFGGYHILKWVYRRQRTQEFIWGSRNPYYNADFVTSRSDLNQKIQNLQAERRELKKQLRELEQTLEQLKTENNDLRNYARNIRSAEKLLNDKHRDLNHKNEILNNVLKEAHRIQKNILTRVGVSSGNVGHQNIDCLQEIVNCLPKITYDKLAYKYSAIWIIRSDQIISIRRANGLLPESMLREFKKGEGFVGDIWAKGEGDICDDVSQDDRFKGENLRPSGEYQAIIGYPIKNSCGQVIGVITVQHPNIRGFRREDMQLLQHISVLLSIVLEFDKVLEGSGNDQRGVFREAATDTTTP